MKKMIQFIFRAVGAGLVWVALFIALYLGAKSAGYFPAVDAADVVPTCLYPAAGVVVDVEQLNDDGDDLVTVETADGMTYRYIGDDMNSGDIVALIMHDNGTATVYDDAIVAARYERLPYME